MDMEEYLEKRAKKINETIKEYLNDTNSQRYLGKLLGRSGYEYDSEAITKGIIDPANYLLDLGGKRWRPILMLEVLEAFGKNPDDYAEFSIIPEIVHNGTLIHDDIEDNSNTRRGAPAIHVKYGIDVALNLGDFMFYFPMVAVLDSKKLSQETKMKMLTIYQKDMLKISVGQAIDIAWHRNLVDPMSVNEGKYMQMVDAKTGVLSSMAAELGGAIGGADDKTIAALGKFGSSIGIAFQLEDDLLNITKSRLAEKKGGVGDDIQEGKVTMLVIYTLEHSAEADRKRLIQILKSHTDNKEEIAEAIAIIDKYGAKDYTKALAQRLVSDAWKALDQLLPDSEAKKRIKAISEFLVGRTI
ncbi:Short chain isoprenyl diphosphate synthase [uncultured archaeon]|nr:Short chain isoprenyl diphosphate synthase [uncultured archaeon]